MVSLGAGAGQAAALGTLRVSRGWRQRWPGDHGQHAEPRQHRGVMFREGEGGGSPGRRLSPAPPGGRWEVARGPSRRVLLPLPSGTVLWRDGALCSRGRPWCGVRGSCWNPLAEVGGTGSRRGPGALPEERVTLGTGGNRNGMLCHCRAGGHAPRSTRNVPGAVGLWSKAGCVVAPGLSLGDGVGGGVPGSRGVTGRCRCHGVWVRFVWRVHQLQALT